jgi:acetylornithine deacetylase/succinyl-diaminopimelate desuccinylase-like protein
VAVYPAEMDPIRRAHRAVEASFPQHLQRCRDFLRRKSVSATGEGIRETAAMVKAYIEEIGGRVRLCGDPAFPIVFGRLDQGAEATLVIYGMYDVQPADEPNWISPPFAAEIQQLPGLGECVIARGAVNSKGALCGVFNVLKTLQQIDHIPVNLVFTIEGEEEIGSPNFETFVRTNRTEIEGDAVVDFDFSQDSKGRVSMHLGLKGIVYLDLVCRGGRKGGGEEGSMHGSVSAWVSSPVWRLIYALSSLTDIKEDIRIPGFYDHVEPLDKTEVELLEKLAATFDEKAFLKEMKSLCFKYDRRGIDLLKRGLYSPIINIDGFHAGYAGAGTKTVLPRKATAKIDVRFGPGLEPTEVIEKFKAYLAGQGFDDIEINVRDCYTWSKTDVHDPMVQTMIGAYRSHRIEPEVWPIATWAAPYFVFSQILKMPVVSGGLGHGGRQHAANEYMTVKGLLDFEKFVATFLYLTASRKKP